VLSNGNFGVTLTNTSGYYGKLLADLHGFHSGHLSVNFNPVVIAFSSVSQTMPCPQEMPSKRQPIVLKIISILPPVVHTMI
jgi:hypothetical protein